MTGYAWPPETPKIIKNFQGTGIDIYEQIFGALSQDPTSCYSRISVANACFSLDPFSGCPCRCAYCVSFSSARDLSVKNGNISSSSKPQRIFNGRELLDALLVHPAFIPNQSVIGIGMSSTESFLPETENETWEIMNRLCESGLKNPIWIISKSGIQVRSISNWLNRFEYLVSKGINIIISISYSALPNWIEPYEGKRFANVREIKSTGVKISHHLRPVIRGINNTKEFAEIAAESSHGLCDVICVGGIRRDPGLILSWKYVHNLDDKLIPHAKGKDLPEDYIALVHNKLKEMGSNVPVFNKSSKAVSYLLGIRDYNLSDMRSKDDSFLTVPDELKEQLITKYNLSLDLLVEECAKLIGLDDLRSTNIDNKIKLNRVLSFQENTLLVHALGHKLNSFAIG